MTAPGGTRADRLDGNSATGDQTVGRFLKLMAAARGWWPSKTAVELAAILGCDVRSAERYLAGQRTPDARALIDLICSSHGVQVIALIAADMPSREQATFWRELGRAARRAELIEERARLERELKSVGG